MPPPRIWKLEMASCPTRSLLNVFYVCGNRSDHGYNGFRVERSNLLSQTSLAFTACAPAGVPRHIVYGFTTKIDEITTKGAKGIEEFGAIPQRRKGFKKRRPDRAVEP